jgi:hypothetical protein
MAPTLSLTGDAEADQLLTENPFALLTGMLLDQQIAMEVAFAGPRKIADRMGGFSVTAIAEADLDSMAHIALRLDDNHLLMATDVVGSASVRRGVVARGARAGCRRTWRRCCDRGGRPGVCDARHGLRAPGRRSPRAETACDVTRADR